MFHRVHQFDLVEADGRLYRPRAYGEPRPDGLWNGWLVFFPLTGGQAIATDRKTTQSTFQALADWASSLGPVYIEGALVRALALAEQPPLVTQLARAEYDALEDADRLRIAAGVERAAAKIDEAAAAAAEDEAERLHEDRLAAERTLAETEEAAAKLEASIHENAARTARAAAVDAARRKREAQQQVSREGRSTRGGKKKR